MCNREIVVAYKDRLVRFELIEDLIKKIFWWKIIVINKKEIISHEEEFALDVLQIIIGLRKYKIKEKKRFLYKSIKNITFILLITTLFYVRFVQFVIFSIYDCFILNLLFWIYYFEFIILNLLF